MTENVLDIMHLHVEFFGRTVLRDVCVSLPKGGMTVFVGPNGAGKTTSFYMIVGFIKSNGGSISINGEDITAMAMHERSRMGLAYLPQEPSIFRKLTVEKNIRLVLEAQSYLTKKERRAKEEELLTAFGIDRVRKQYGYTLSGGERRRTEIARALATSPKFLLLDEPFAGIDPKAVYEIKQIIKHLSDNGIGILLTDHNVRDTLEITTKAHIISDGEILVSGTRREVLENDRAKEIYFGHDYEEY